MALVRREIRLTESIIHVIKNEKAEVIADFIKKKEESRILDFK